MERDEALQIIKLIADGKDPFTTEGSSNNAIENIRTTMRAICVVVADLVQPLNESPPSTEGAPFEEVLKGKLPLEEAARRVERETILKALELNRYNRTATAEFLGMSYRTLRYKLKQHEIG